MSTPTKRRKTNNYKPSPKTVGSLDFFFGKQKDGQLSNKSDDHAASEASDKLVAQDGLTLDQATEYLTDEELARKLQYEWDEQDKVRSGVAADAGEKGTAGSRKDSRAEEKNSEAAWSGAAPSTASFSNGQNSAQAPEPYSKPSSEKKDKLSLQSTASAEGMVSSTVPFDENPLIFEPSKYLPDLRKHWAEFGGNASYGMLTRCFILVNSTQSRIKIVDTLVNFLRTLIEGDPQSLLPAVSLKTNFWLLS